jgi:hypothetical protein
VDSIQVFAAGREAGCAFGADAGARAAAFAGAAAVRGFTGSGTSQGSSWKLISPLASVQVKISWSSSARARSATPTTRSQMGAARRMRRI